MHHRMFPIVRDNGTLAGSVSGQVKFLYHMKETWCGKPDLVLKRYFSESKTDHWVTAFDLPNTEDYARGASLGRFYSHKVDGSKELFECLADSRDHFISKDALCEGKQKLRSLGFVFESPQEGRVPIFRCLTSNKKSHFVSRDATCEGHSKVDLLGFVNPMR